MRLSQRIFITETTDWKIQLFRYAFVGGFAFIVDFILLYILTEFAHLHSIISATIAFVAGLVVNYFISTQWIFRQSKLSNIVWEFIIYTIIGIIGLILNDLLLFIFTDYLHIHYMISKIITAVLVMGWNFVGRRTILFKN